jgi:hypothetical protein
VSAAIDAKRREISDLRNRDSWCDSEIAAAEDAGEFLKAVERQQEKASLAKKLGPLQIELARLEVEERNANNTKKLPGLVDTINLARSKVRDTLPPLSAAVADISDAVLYQRSTAAWCRHALTELSDVDGVSLGPVAAVRLSGVTTRFRDESSEVVTELCRILEPTFRTLEPAIADVLRNRIRSGNRLAAA